MTTRNAIEKRIYTELLKTEQHGTVTIQFIPEELEVRNLATYLQGANAEEAKERMFLAFHAAYHFAGQKGLDISTVTIAKGDSGSAYCSGFSKGAMVFSAERTETKDELENRLRYMANTQMHKEWAPIAEKNRAERALARAQAEVDKLA